jgi:hypothetical protein
VALELNGTHQCLSYADDVNLLADNIGTTNKNTETLIDASKEVVSYSVWTAHMNILKHRYMYVCMYVFKHSGLGARI